MMSLEDLHLNMPKIEKASWNVDALNLMELLSHEGALLTLHFLLDAWDICSHWVFSDIAL